MKWVTEINGEDTLEETFKPSLKIKFMKQHIFLVVLIIFTSKSFSQSSNLTIEANYPVFIDDNFHGRDVNGIIDIGAKYRFTEIKTVKIGAAINSGLFINNSNLNRDFVDFKITSYLLQPKIFAELNSFKIRPYLGFGYSFLILDVSGTSHEIDVSESSVVKDGINANFGAYYYLTDKIFIQVQYDFFKLKQDKGVPNNKYMTNMNILKLGLGLRL